MKAHSARRRHRRWIQVLPAYLVFTLLSTCVIESTESPPSIHEHTAHAETPVFNANGIVQDRTARIAYSVWKPVKPNLARVPVILLHGSPGNGSGFTSLAAPIVASGRAVYAPDLPGFGESSWALPDLGSRAHARYMLALMDRIGIERAHVVGWSNGGAVALNMADLASDRVLSLTMMASVGLQETEGSGSYVFEHAKYGVGTFAFRLLQLGTPDFGVFGYGWDLNWLINFQQTDQRVLRPIMENLRTPTLILHGRHDFLTPSWGAERHHELMPTSRLVMLDASHFIPFMQVEVATPILESHFSRHDSPGVTPLTDYDNRMPNPERVGAAVWIESLGVRMRTAPWWVLVGLIAGLALHRPMLAAVVCGMYVGRVDLDIAVAWLGLFSGMLLRKRTAFDRPRLWLGCVGTAWWAFASMGIVFILEQDTIPLRVGPDNTTLRFGASGLIGWLILGPIVLHVLGKALRRRGRQQLFAQFTRLTHHEWWPTWAIYLGVVPVWIERLTHKNGPLAFTAANPGIANGGGFVGESKNEIMAGFASDPAVLAFKPIEAAGTPHERAQRSLDAIGSRPELGGLPIILKPDSGERGRSVRLAKTEREVREYFRLVTDPVQAQRFDPGPCEFGVFWVRSTGQPAGETTGELTGLTRKVFQTLTGDGRRTLCKLVLGHPRLRCQAEVFAQRHEAVWHKVLGEGETLRLGQAGNHAEGCKFVDGSDLMSPALLHSIDRLASGFTGLGGQGAGGLDYGRFDVRAASEEALRRGEFAVIEVNGVTSEPTQLYDPAKSFFAASAILRAHWRHLYRVGDARIDRGGRRLGAYAVLSMWLRARRRRAIRAD